MSYRNVSLGEQLICAETGKAFISEREGCSVNYALNNAGEVFSNEGVHIRECRELSHRVGPFFCYLSGNGRTVTGWKGNKLGDVISFTRGGGFGGKMVHIRVRDVHGGIWYGKGAGEGMCITLRPTKNAR